jgi:hypothetical protein
MNQELGFAQFGILMSPKLAAAMPEATWVPRSANTSNFQMKKLDELAHLLANPVFPMASRRWSEADVVISSAPQPEHLTRSLYPRDREILTEHALEVSYFREVLRGPSYEESLVNHCSKIEFSGRLAGAAPACLLEWSDVTAHLVRAGYRSHCAVRKLARPMAVESSAASTTTEVNKSTLWRERPVTGEAA